MLHSSCKIHILLIFTAHQKLIVHFLTSVEYIDGETWKMHFLITVFENTHLSWLLHQISGLNNKFSKKVIAWFCRLFCGFRQRIWKLKKLNFYEFLNKCLAKWWFLLFFLKNNHRDPSLQSREKQLGRIQFFFFKFYSKDHEKSLP